MVYNRKQSKAVIKNNLSNGFFLIVNWECQGGAGTDTKEKIQRMQSNPIRRHDIDVRHSSMITGSFLEQGGEHACKRD